MVKSLTWGECRDHTLRTLDTWRSGGGRESAILYSGYFSEYQGDGFPVHRITKPLITELCVQLEEDKCFGSGQAGQSTSTGYHNNATIGTALAGGLAARGCTASDHTKATVSSFHLGGALTWSF